MQSAAMTAFSLTPPHCHRSCTLATPALRPTGRRPSLTWSWQQPRHAVLQCRQAQKISAAPLPLIDDRLTKTPCDVSPSVWGDFFLHHSNSAASSEQQTWMVERVKKLKKQVAKMIVSSVNYSLLERLQIIDSLERFCVDYLFEEEIEAVLTQINNEDVSDCDLHTVALWFYVLRKHGYNVSADVFAKFKDEEGTFAANTPSELLILYNAAHFKTHGDIILEEAISFTKRCLESKLPYLEGTLASEIRRALQIPLPRRNAIYDAKYYISTYEDDETVNETVLQLAKLNFNLMQLQYQKELQITTRWWKDLETQSTLPFVRDRIVECYFWALGSQYEPSCSRSRIMLAMLNATVTILDDIYDSFGTAEECELFTEWIERWDPKSEYDLPECMKFAFRKIMDRYQTFEDELEQEEKYRMSYLKNFTVDLVTNYNKEVKMREEGYVPQSIEEHLEVSARTISCHLLTCTILVGMDDVATKDSFEWVSADPKMVQGLCIIFRLVDDLKSYEREKMTPHVASTIDTYMKQYNVSIEVACEKIKELKDETCNSKDMQAALVRGIARVYTSSLFPGHSIGLQIIVERRIGYSRNVITFITTCESTTSCSSQLAP